MVFDVAVRRMEETCSNRKLQHGAIISGQEVQFSIVEVVFSSVISTIFFS
jgi:hypothetical protein